MDKYYTLKIPKKEHKNYVKNYLIVGLMEWTNNMIVVCTWFAHYSWIAATKHEIATKAEIILIHNKENSKIIIIFYFYGQGLYQYHTNSTQKWQRNQEIMRAKTK